MVILKMQSESEYHYNLEYEVNGIIASLETPFYIQTFLIIVIHTILNEMNRILLYDAILKNIPVKIVTKLFMHIPVLFSKI